MIAGRQRAGGGPRSSRTVLEDESGFGSRGQMKIANLRFSIPCENYRFQKPVFELTAAVIQGGVHIAHAIHRRSERLKREQHRLGGRFTSLTPHVSIGGLDAIEFRKLRQFTVQSSAPYITRRVPTTAESRRAGCAPS